MDVENRKGTLLESEWPCVQLLYQWYQERGSSENIRAEEVMEALSIDQKQYDHLMGLMIDAGVIDAVRTDGCVAPMFQITTYIVHVYRRLQSRIEAANKPKDVVKCTWDYVRSRPWLAIPLMVLTGAGMVVTFITSVLVLLEKLGLIQ